MTPCSVGMKTLILLANVATDWTLAKWNTWTFKIHQGIKFHNGDALTADDVKFSVDRFSDMSQSTNPWSYFLSKIYNQVETKLSMIIPSNSSRPNPNCPRLSFSPGCVFFPRTYYESVGRMHSVESNWFRCMEVEGTYHETKSNPGSKHLILEHSLYTSLPILY